MTGKIWGHRRSRVPAMRSAMEFAQSRPAHRLHGPTGLGVLLFAFCAALALSRVASAQMDILENFESYADDTALRAAWVPLAPLPPGI